MKKLYTTVLVVITLSAAQAQTWTKVSGIMDSSQVKGVGIINNQILVAGQNWVTNTQTDYALSNDGGNTWSKLPTYQYAGYFPNELPQNNLLICSNGFTFSKKLVGSTWQSFSGANNFAEFSNGSIIGSQGSFPDTVYNFSSAGVKGAKLGNYKFKLSSKYCKGSNNRLFLFAYGSGLGYVDYSNLSVINFPATLDGVTMTESSWQAKSITDMVQTSNGNLFAVDNLGYGIFKSTDNGINWTTIYTQSGAAFISITKNATDELFVLAGNAEVRKSSDLGVSFTNISGNLPSLGFKREIVVNATNEIFCFVSSNGGFNVATSGIYKLTNINGINDVDKNKLVFNLYPNPTNSVINVESLFFNKNTTTIEITNTLGQVILSKNITESNTQLNVSDFTKGIYYITVKSDNKVSTQKLIVN